jgi:hypothetical protein
MTFLESGCAERVKGGWHLGGLLFAGGAALYNIGALLQRRETHLAVNTLVYSALTIFELRKVTHHFRDC